MQAHTLCVHPRGAASLGHESGEALTRATVWTDPEHTRRSASAEHTEPHGVTPLTRRVQNRGVRGDRKRASGCQGLGGDCRWEGLPFGVKEGSERDGAGAGPRERARQRHTVGGSLCARRISTGAASPERPLLRVHTHGAGGGTCGCRRGTGLPASATRGSLTPCPPAAPPLTKTRGRSRALLQLNLGSGPSTFSGTMTNSRFKSTQLSRKGHTHADVPSACIGALGPAAAPSWAWPPRPHSPPSRRGWAAPRWPGGC